MRKSKKTAERLTWLVITIVMVVTYAGIFWYVKTDFQKASYALSSAQIAYEQKDKVENTAQTIKSLEPEIAQIDAYFVGPDDVVGFVNLLETLGASAETNNISIEQDESLIYGEVLEVSLSVSGSWSQVMSYINEVESLPYNVWITATKVSLESQEDSTYWIADITLRVLKHK